VVDVVPCVQVRAADAATQDLDEDVTGAWLRFGTLDHPEIAMLADDCFHSTPPRLARSTQPDLVAGTLFIRPAELAFHDK
jgi:hypothetical protein